MNKEVEIRFRLESTNPDKLVKELIDTYSFKFITSEQEDSYFCPVSYFDSGKTKDTPFVLRLRKAVKNSFCYKSFSGDGSWIELETEITNPVALEQILDKISFKKYLEIKKKRFSTQYKDFEINIDVIENLGDFVEIELLSANVSEAKVRILKCAEEIFSVDESKIEHRGYVQLMQEI